MKHIVLLLIFILISCNEGINDKDFPELKGEYLGQNPPGKEPEIFAPGIVNTGLYTRDFTVTPDGSEIFFSVAVGNYSYSTIMHTKRVDGIWTKPEVAEFATEPEYLHIEPSISPDGRTLFFVSNKPIDENDTTKDANIWAAARKGKTWDKPKPLGPFINTEADEFFPCQTLKGTLYFTRETGGAESGIYKSAFLNDEFTIAEYLDSNVNCGTSRFNAYAAPDESFIIVPALGLKDSFGSVDYYVVFAKSEDSWYPPVNMGDKINSENGLEFSPYVTPDGKYFFFMSSKKTKKPKETGTLTFEKLLKMHNSPGFGNPSIWWIDADFIKDLKKQVINKSTVL